MNAERVQLEAERLAQQANDLGLGAIVILGDVEGSALACQFNIEGSVVHIDPSCMRLVFEPELEARVKAGDLFALTARTRLVEQAVAYLLAMEANALQVAETMTRIGTTLRRYAGAQGLHGAAGGGSGGTNGTHRHQGRHEREGDRR